MAILPPAQVRLWPELRPAAALGFVLYGGTAIALRLGHRQSIDFDLFSAQPLDRVALFNAFPFLARSLVLQDQPNTLSVLAGSGDDDRQQVKLSFFGGIGFGRVGSPDRSADGVLQVAALDDLMAAKLKVLLQRAQAAQTPGQEGVDASALAHCRTGSSARTGKRQQVRERESAGAAIKAASIASGRISVRDSGPWLS